MHPSTAALFRQGATPGDWCCLLVAVLTAVNCCGSCGPFTMILVTSFAINSVFWANRLIHKQPTWTGAMSWVVKSPFADGPDCSQVKTSSVPLIKSEKRDLWLAVLTALLVWRLAVFLDPWIRIRALTMSRNVTDHSRAPSRVSY